MSDESGTYAYQQSLIAELSETAVDAIAMLEARLELDPIFLLDVCATAGLLEHAELPEDVAASRDALYAAATSKRGSDVLALATAELDLGPSLDLDPSGDMAEQGDRLARLTELAGLATVVDKATRARLQDRLDHNVGLVLAYSDSFDPLWATAAFLRDAIPAPKTHLAKSFLAGVLNALAPELYAVDHASLATRLERLFASDSRTWWQRLKDKTSATLAVVGDFLSVPQPVTAYASHAPSRLTWPVPRLILSQTPDGELNLIHFGTPRLEWIGDRCMGVLLDSQSLMPTHGPLRVASYFELPDPSVASTVTVLLDGALTLEWASLLPRSSNFEAPSFRWRQIAPGAARREILAYLPSEPSLARRRELEDLANALTPRPLECAVGVMHFPVVGAPGTGFLGALLPVRVELGRSARPSQDEVAVSSALESLGIESAPEFTFRVDTRGLELEGASLQLAALIAAVSRLIGREPLIPIASGLVGDVEVHPADHLEAKSQIIGNEAPAVPSLLPTNPTPVREVLFAAFGPDVMVALTAACRVTATALVAKAKGLRDEDRRQADELAESAIAAGAVGLDLADAHWVRAAIALHAARTDDALAHFDLACQALDAAPGRKRRFIAEELESFVAIAEIDRLRPARAVSVLERALERLDAVAEPDRDARWDEVRIQVVGSLARAVLMVGELDRAIALLSGSRDLSDVPRERARTLGDLADLYRRAGRLVEAHELLNAARASLDHIPSIVQKNRTMRFLELFEVRAGLAEPHYQIVPTRWADWPQPAEAIESLIAADINGVAAWVSTAIADPTLPPVGLLILRAALARAELAGAAPSSPVSIVQLHATIAERLREAGADSSLVDMTDPHGLIRTCPY